MTRELVGLPACLLIGTVALLVLWRCLLFEIRWHDLPDVNLHEYKGPTLAMGYGGATLLFLAYFAWERACCHSSQEHENSYQVGILALIIFSTVTVCMMELFYREVDSLIQTIDGLLVLLLTMVSIRIARTVCSPQVLGGFFDSSIEGGMMKADDYKRDPRATMIASELATDIADMLALESGSGLSLPTGAFNLTLLIFLMCFELILHSKSLRLWLAHWHVLLMAFSFLLARLVHGQHTRCRGAGQLRNHMHSTVTALIDDAVHFKDQSLLMHVLSRISVGTLLEVAWHKTGTELVLRPLREGLLNVTSKAILLDALQKRGLRAQVRRQRLVRAIFLDTTGMDLTRLKNFIDYGGDYYNLSNMIQSLSDAEIRNDVKRHIAREARVVRQANGGGSVGNKVLSDVDDTLYSSGGKFPAGCDRSYPRHTLYPGCLELYRILDRSWTEGDATSCNLVFLSARPHVYKSVAEDQSYHLFSSLVKDGRMHSIPTLLPGDLIRGLAAMLTYACLHTTAWKLVGEQKYTTFKDFASLYPEYDFVFCGDNGQGDLLAGQLMVGEHQDGNSSDSSDFDLEGEHKCVHDSVKCVLIHKVMEHKDSLAVEPPGKRTAQWEEDYRRRGLIFHRTYVGAALELFRRGSGLVSALQLQEVMRAALNDFAWAVTSFPDFHGWEAAADILAEDIQEANGVLEAEGLERVNEVLHEEVRQAAQNSRAHRLRFRVRREAPASQPGLCGNADHDSDIESFEDLSDEADDDREQFLP